MSRHSSALFVAFLALATFGSSLHAAGPATRPAWPQRQVVSGVVQDEGGRPVRGAIVFIQNAETGVPYSNVTDHPFTDMRIAGEPPLFSHVASGPDGHFHLRGVFPGTYRVVAQSWEDVESIQDLVSTSSEVTALRGVVENVRLVEGKDPAPLVLKPAGTATLHVTFELDNTYVLVSTRPLSGDPLLGPLAWKWDFLRNLVAVTRMASQQATMHGLPEGTLYLYALSNDFQSGLGAATVNTKAAALSEVAIPLISPDNGPMKMPERWAALDALMKKDPRAVESAARAALGPAEKLWDGPTGLLELFDSLDREVALPRGLTVTLRDIASVRVYQEFNRRAEEIAKRNASPRKGY